MTTRDLRAKRAAIHAYARRRDELAIDARTLLLDGWTGWAAETSLFTHIVDRAMRAEIDDPVPVGSRVVVRG